MFFKSFVAIAIACLASGCTITMSPGVEFDEKKQIPAMGEAAAGKPVAAPAPAGAMVESKFGFNTFQLERSAWNQRLAASLTEELRKYGADVTKGPAVQVELTDYQYNQQDLPLVTNYQARVGVEVTVGEFKKRYTGDQSTPKSSTNAAWQAAANALHQIMSDPQFRAAIGAK